MLTMDKYGRLADTAIVYSRPHARYRVTWRRWVLGFVDYMHDGEALLKEWEPRIERYKWLARFIRFAANAIVPRLRKWKRRCGNKVVMGA